MALPYIIPPSATSVGGGQRFERKLSGSDRLFKTLASVAKNTTSYNQMMLKQEQELEKKKQELDALSEDAMRETLGDDADYFINTFNVRDFGDK